MVDEKFQLKDLASLRYSLGLVVQIEIAKSKQGIFVNQRKDATEILADFGLLCFKLVKIPMEQNLKLAKMKVSQSRTFHSTKQSQGDSSIEQ